MKVHLFYRKLSARDRRIRLMGGVGGWRCGLGGGRWIGMHGFGILMCLGVLIMGVVSWLYRLWVVVYEEGSGLEAGYG